MWLNTSQIPQFVHLNSSAGDEAWSYLSNLKDWILHCVRTHLTRDSCHRLWCPWSSCWSQRRQTWSWCGSTHRRCCQAPSRAAGLRCSTSSLSITSTDSSTPKTPHTPNWDISCCLRHSCVATRCVTGNSLPPSFIRQNGGAWNVIPWDKRNLCHVKWYPWL